MTNVYLNLPKTSWIFYLQGDVTTAMDKQFSDLGFPIISFYASDDKDFIFNDVGENRIVQVGGSMNQMIPLDMPTQNGSFSANYSASDKTVILTLDGEFASYPIDDQETLQRYRKITEGFVLNISFRDRKGKVIKKPKDQYGMSDPVEGTASKNAYTGPWYRIPLAITVKE